MTSKTVKIVLEVRVKQGDPADLRTGEAMDKLAEVVETEWADEFGVYCVASARVVK